MSRGFDVNCLGAIRMRDLVELWEQFNFQTRRRWVPAIGPPALLTPAELDCQALHIGRPTLLRDNVMIGVLESFRTNGQPKRADRRC